MATLRLEVEDPSVDDLARFVDVLDSLGVRGGRKVTVEARPYTLDIGYGAGTKNYERHVIKVEQDMSAVVIEGEG